MVTKAHCDCTTCTSHKRLVWFDNNGVAQIERHFCTYLERSLTDEEVKEACDAYEESWDD